MAIGSPQWMYNSGSEYEIDQSLRFNDDDSAYLSKTFASAGNRKTWTWSTWVKRGNLTSSTQKISGAFNGTNEDSFNFNSDKNSNQLTKVLSNISKSNKILDLVGPEIIKFEDFVKYFVKNKKTIINKILL